MAAEAPSPADADLSPPPATAATAADGAAAAADDTAPPQHLTGTAVASLSTLPVDCLAQLVEFLTPIESYALAAVESHTLAGLVELPEVSVDRADAPTGGARRSKRGALADDATRAVAARLLRYHALESLQLQRFDGAGDEVVEPVIDKHRATLMELSLSGSGVANVDLRLPMLGTLDLSRCASLYNPRIDCPRLRALDISSTFVSDMDFVRAFSGPGAAGAPGLRVLRVRNCKNLTLRDVTEEGLTLPALEVLDCTRTPITERAISQVASVAPRLKALFLCECRPLKTIILDLPELETLSARGVPRLRALRLECPKLRELSLDETPIGAAEYLVTVLAVASTLEVLSLRNCHELVASGPLAGGGTADIPEAAADPTIATALAAVAEGAMRFPRLVSLDLTMSGIDDAGARAFVAAAPVLRTLSVRQCYSITEDFSIAHDTLRALTVAATIVGDDAMLATVAGCPELQELDARNCVRYTAVGLASDKVHTLDLSLSRVTDEALHAALHWLPRLTTLRMTSTRKLREPVIESASLRHLEMGTCNELTALTLRTPQLQTIDISGTSMLTRADLDAPQLRSANVSFTSARVINALRKNNPGTKLVAPTDVRGLRMVDDGNSVKRWLEKGPLTPTSGGRKPGGLLKAVTPPDDGAVGGDRKDDSPFTPKGATGAAATAAAAAVSPSRDSGAGSGSGSGGGAESLEAATPATARAAAAAAGAGAAAAATAAPRTSPRDADGAGADSDRLMSGDLFALEERKAGLQAQLDAPGVTKMTAYGLRRRIAKVNADMIRERRRLHAARDESG